MQLDSMSTAQRDSLTATAQGAIRIILPTVNGAPDHDLMHGAIVSINRVQLMEGDQWDATDDVQATAAALAAAINAATADTHCTATVGDVEPFFILLTATDPGPDGNKISISCFMPQYTVPSGSSLVGGAIPATGTMIYNTTTNKANLFTTEWEEMTSAATVPVP